MHFPRTSGEKSESLLMTSGCLDEGKQNVELQTGEAFNFCLVNYYASGNDSISYHSDDEQFLGKHPVIASFSLGAKRDFLMRHKPVENTRSPRPTEPPSDNIAKQLDRASGKGSTPLPQLKLSLACGAMVLMRGATQSHWLHSIPKRKGDAAAAAVFGAEKGRINITFRKALAPAGTQNYYRYNVGREDSPVFRWDDGAGEMKLWDRTKE